MAAELRALAEIEPTVDAIEELLDCVGMRGPKARRLALLGAALATHYLPKYAPIVEANDTDARYSN